MNFLYIYKERKTGNWNDYQKYGRYSDFEAVGR